MSRPYASARALVAATAFAGSAFAGALAASAQEATVPLQLELNRLEPQSEACRAYLLVDNSRGEMVRSLKLDLFILDTQGVAQKRLAVEAGPIATRKTVIKVFDVAGVACPTVGRVLLNDVLSCEGAGAPRTDCLDHLETSSKVPSVAFGK